MPDAVLDGELVVPDEHGHADFEALRRRAFTRRPGGIADAVATHPAALIVFDVLQANSKNMRHQPLIERKAWLHANIAPRAGLQLVESVERQGEALFALASAQDFERVVAKRMDSAYVSGPAACWVKVKNRAYSRRQALERHD